MGGWGESASPGPWVETLIGAHRFPANVPTAPLVRPVVLCILDGWGVSDRMEGNAVEIARTPNLDNILYEGCRTTIAVSGRSVGLPEGQMGNSEIGHLNMGAGRVVYQSLTRINNAIADGSFFRNEALRESMVLAEARESSLHLMGLTSRGGVHSHVDHLEALLKMGVRAEQQALAKWGLNYVIDEYLPRKLGRTKDFLP